MTLYELDEDTALTRRSEGCYDGRITERWSIGHVPNGGYVLAFGLAALEQALPYQDPLVASAFYLSPAEAGPAQVHVEVIKVGRRYATAEARIVQAERERVRVLATFGTLAPRDEGELHELAEPPPLPPRAECSDDRPAGVFPEIARRFELGVDPATLGFLRGERSEDAVIRGYLRFADGRPLDLRALAVVADAFPPPAFHLVSPGWVPTLELNVHFRARPRSEWLRCAFRTRFLFGGHLEEDGEIWDDEGLVALSRQIAVVPR